MCIRDSAWTARPDAPHIARQSQAIEDAILDATSSAGGHAPRNPAEAS